MSRDRKMTLPPLTRSQTRRASHFYTLHKDSVHTSDEGQEGTAGSKTLRWTGSSYMYAGPGRKPQLLLELENYMNKELQTINPQKPQFQELKLQVCRKVFGCLIGVFRTYQPLLSAIKREYENTLAHQQSLIRELEPLRSRLRLMGEECDQKIQERRGEQQAEVETLKREKQQLKKDIEAMREKEKAMQTTVDHLQSELSNQYLQFREERDARKLLIWQLNDLTRGSTTRERSADKNTGREDSKDAVELKLALKVCREDLTKTQDELIRMKAEYWDVVPRRNWDTLEQNHKQTQLQLKTLQGDFDQLKRECDTMLELHNKGSIQTKTHVSVAVQMEEDLFQVQKQTHSDHLEEPINANDISESNTVSVQGFRDTLMTTKSYEEEDTGVTMDEMTADSSK